MDSQVAASGGRTPPVHHEGDVLAGRYRLLHPLGEGGMGSVWKARCLVLDVDVAVKVVKRTASSPKACERLLREARAAAPLAHPSIVRVLDFGVTEAGEPFLVMQLLRGKTLGAWLEERGKLPATTAVQLVLPIAGALAEVHDLGIVHRDIKPENTVVEEATGGHLVPKLVDFGIAKHNSGVEQSNLTLSGVLMGSPAYMSPEQARGEHDIGAQSDVWSLCVMLYEMITGTRPFDGPNHGAVLFAVFAHAPAPTHTQDAGDEELWEILRRGLAKEQGDRWQTMKQLGRALAAWAVAHGVTADAAGTSIPHQWLGRRGSRAVDMGPEPTSDQARRPRTPELTNTAFHIHTISSPCPDEAGVSSDVVLPRRRRGQVMGLGGALMVVVGILTFFVLSPAAPRGGAAATGSPMAFNMAAAAVTPATIAAKQAAPVPATVEVVPALTTPPATAKTAEVREPSRTAKAAPTAAPRRPATVKTPLPLPTGPGF